MITGRVTTSMTQRNVLSDLNSLSAKLARTQAKAASGREITRPSDDPFGTAKAMGARASIDATTQYKKNIDDATGWQDTTETALAGMGDDLKAARDVIVQGSNDTLDQTARNALALQLDQLINSLKDNASANVGGIYVMSGSKTDTAPYVQGADDTYKGDDAGLDPAIPGVLRQIGPGVTMSINTVGREILGDGQASGDGKMLNVLRDAADHLRANDSTALRTDLGRTDQNLDTLLGARSRNGAQTNRLEAAASRLDQIQSALTQQLSNTEDADFTKTMIDFNSQSTAYQAALKAGASIVQSSLMDFLR
jgi:flagellar hook-associated protein 3 FlgL